MLVDANVFKGYFQVDIGKSHALCGCPRALFESVSKQAPLFHDEGKIVEEEWRRVVDRDWFDAWLSASLQSGLIQYLRPTRDVSIEKKLLQAGFPGGRDMVYVRIGIAATSVESPCRFYTEDLDFYNPTQKGCPADRRTNMLRSSSGPVPKILAKVGIEVRCVP